jgi:hypothetical protein
MRLSIDAILLKTSNPYCWGIWKGAGTRCILVPNLPGCDMIKALRAVQTCTSTSRISKMTTCLMSLYFFYCIYILKFSLILFMWFAVCGGDMPYLGLGTQGTTDKSIIKSSIAKLS